MKKVILKKVIMILIVLVFLVAMSVFTVSAAECTGSHDYDNNGFCTVCGGYEPVQSKDGGSEGTEDDYYEIENAGQLLWFAGNSTLSSQYNLNVYLKNNIDLNPDYSFTFVPDTGLIAVTKKSDSTAVYIGTGFKGDTSGENEYFDGSISAKGQFYQLNGSAYESTNEPEYLRKWTPISSFNGTFDGKGYSVSGLYFNNSATNNVGLFGTVNTCIIKNVTVANSYFFAAGNVGAICGNNDGTIENCGSDSNAVCGKSANVGGVCGYNYKTIYKCYNTGIVVGSSASEYEYSYVGGVCGYNLYVHDGTIESCYNTGLVDGNEYIGGICGTNNETIKNCYNIGMVRGAHYVGGVSGNNNNGGTITNSFYLDGCAKNYSGISCHGIGRYTPSTDVTDATGETETMILEQFTEGEAAYELNGKRSEGTIDDPLIWYQKLTGADADNSPVLGGDIVYYGYVNCSSTKKTYANTVLHDTIPYHTGDVWTDNGNGTHTGFCSVCNEERTANHIFNQEGFCTACGSYMPANETTDKYDIDSDNTYDVVYEIANAGQLNWFAAQVNGGNSIINGRLMADIHLNPGYTFTFAPDTGLVTIKKDGVIVGYLGTGVNGVAGGNTGFDTNASERGQYYTTGYIKVDDPGDLRKWIPIGNSDKCYKGAFDGDNKTVHEMYCNITGSYAGMFGFIYNDPEVGANPGSVKNVTIENAYISGQNEVGGICGSNFKAQIYNCHNRGVLGGAFNIGGICGQNDGIIDACSNSGYVTCNSQMIGGVCGNNYGEIVNCYNTGDVIGGYNIGGVCASNKSSATVKYCYNTGSVRGTYFIGGVCASNQDNAKIESCYNTGSVTGNTYIGGICASYRGGSMTGCYNTGAVTGTDDYVGGICGWFENGTITACYYLIDCATDGADKKQFGIGNNDKGVTTADLAWNTDGKTAGQFADGSVTHALNLNRNEETEENPLVWYQKIGTDHSPIFDKANDNTVYYGYENCGSAEKTYSNTIRHNVNPPHNYNINGFCIVCNVYQPARKTTDIHDINGDGTKDIVYEIANAGQLYWFAEEVNGGNNTINGKLMENIHLNPGYTFTYAIDTGLVAVKKGDTTVYIGTGIKIDKYGSSIFDENAPLRGIFYSSDNNLDNTTSAPSDLSIWTPIGNNVKPYKGCFDGNGKSVSELYFNDDEKWYVGLFGYTDLADNSLVKNLMVLNSYINGNSYVGGICGKSSGKIENCANNATVNGYENVGGICGGLNNTVKNCFNIGAIRSVYYAGGVCGFKPDILDENIKAINCYYLYNCVYDKSKMTCYGIGSGTYNRLDTPGVTTPISVYDLTLASFAWKLNTAGKKVGDEGYLHSGVWSQGTEYPVIADETNKAVYKVSLTGAGNSNYYLRSGETFTLDENFHSAGYIAPFTVTKDVVLTADAYISGALATVTDSVRFTFFVSVANGFSPKLSIDFAGKTISLEPTTGPRIDGNYSSYEFEFEGILPQQMTELILVTLMINDTAYATKSDYSVKVYLFNVLRRSGDETEKRFLVNMLYYGEAAQRYLGQTTNLATDGLDELLGEGVAESYRTSENVWADHPTNPLPSLISVKDVKNAGETDLITWKSATLVFNKTITMRLRFTTTKTVEELSECTFVSSFVKGSISFDKAVYDAENGTYYIDIEGFTPTDYTTSVTVMLKAEDGMTVSGTAIYSIMSYIENKRDSELMEMLVKNLYDYCISGIAYKAG